MNYTHFYPSQPDNGGAGEDCLVMQSTDGTWWDVSCHLSRSYICESVWVRKHNVLYSNNVVVNKRELKHQAVNVNYDICESVWVRKHNVVHVNSYLN